MDILRFITAGNIDDGKSTLIGRLLLDTNNIKADILESVYSKHTHSADINLAHVTDGLRAERQQGITIDVAYKYFATKHRKFIITDAPGHFHYTKNLVTGASNADLIIILVDAHNGITDQTRRHSLVASFLKIGHVIVAVNKMDNAGFNEDVFNSIRSEYTVIADQLSLPEVTYLPISALLGDNVSFPSEKMEWYTGKTLLEYLEACEPAKVNFDEPRCIIQHTTTESGKRLYAGKMLSGTLSTNTEALLWPGKSSVNISKIYSGSGEITLATAGQNISLYLRGEKTAKRGDIISGLAGGMQCSTQFTADICWLDGELPMETGKEYFLRINTFETICCIREIIYKIDTNNFAHYNDEAPLKVNQFARVLISTADAVAFDPFRNLPENGRGIIIDAKTNNTSGAFTIEDSKE
jgi:sulfate adenylyltransferase subunit 1